MAAAAERISAGRMITWVDPAFSKLDPWALSKEYAANILGGSSVETAVKDMNTAVATRSSWPDRHSRASTPPAALPLRAAWLFAFGERVRYNGRK